MPNDNSLTLTKILAIIYFYKRKYPKYKQLYTITITTIIVVSIIIITIIIIMVIIITIIPKTRKSSPKPGNTGLMSRGG